MHTWLSWSVGPPTPCKKPVQPQPCKGAAGPSDLPPPSPTGADCTRVDTDSAQSTSKPSPGGWSEAEGGKASAGSSHRPGGGHEMSTAVLGFWASHTHPTHTPHTHPMHTHTPHAHPHTHTLCTHPHTHTMHTHPHTLCTPTHTTPSHNYYLPQRLSCVLVLAGKYDDSTLTLMPAGPKSSHLSGIQRMGTWLARVGGALVLTHRWRRGPWSRAPPGPVLVSPSQGSRTVTANPAHGDGLRGEMTMWAQLRLRCRGCAFRGLEMKMRLTFQRNVIFDAFRQQTVSKVKADLCLGSYRPGT